MSKKGKTTKTRKSTGSKTGTGIMEVQALRTKTSAARGLKGGISNASVTNAPDSRPAYPHILAVGSSECSGSVMSGLTGPWKATLLNLLGHPSRSHHDNMALYNITRTPGSRQQMTTRLGVTRPLSAMSYMRTAFYTNPEIKGVSSMITPFDAIVPTQDWHSEFSFEIGRVVKFLQFCIQVDGVYWEQHQYGGASYDPEETKANGHKFTPYERLYNELLSQMPTTQELNIPDHMAENKKLSDLAKAALARLSPVASGQLADTWVFHDYHHILQEPFLRGLESLDFGTIIDTDGNVRMMVQLPTTKLGARSTSETFNSVADKVYYDSRKAVEFTGNEAHIAGQNWTTGSGIGTLLYLASMGYTPGTGRPDNLPANHVWVGDIQAAYYPGINEWNTVTQNLATAGAQIVEQLIPDHQPYGTATAEYSPLFADTSSWILKAERDAATSEQKYFDLREVEDFSAIRSTSLNQNLHNLSLGNSKDYSIEGGNPLYSTTAPLNYSDYVNEANTYIDENGVPTENFPYKDSNGQPLPEGTICVYHNSEMWQYIVDQAKKLRVTSKLYTKNIFEVFKYLEAVSQVLPPEYLALGLPRVTGFTLGDGKINKPKLMDKVIDMKNRDASMRPKFNPRHNISANNGPFWNGASAEFREKYWLAPNQGFGDWADNKFFLDQLFTNMHIPSGAGEYGLPLADVFSMHNPRITTALWTMNQSAINKKERYVVVPAGRESANNGYMSELGDHKEGHLFDLLYSIWGTFRVDTTFPLYDLDFGAWQGQNVGDGFCAVATTTIKPSGRFIEEVCGPENGFQAVYSGEVTHVTGVEPRGPEMDSDLMKFRLRWNRNDFEDEMGVDFRLEDRVQDDGSVDQIYVVDGRVNVATSLLGQRIAVEYGFPSLNAVCKNSDYTEDGSTISVNDATGLMLIPTNDVETTPGSWGREGERRSGQREYRNVNLPSDGTIIYFAGIDRTPLMLSRSTALEKYSTTFDAAGIDEDEGSILASFNVSGGRAEAWDKMKTRLEELELTHLLGNNATLDADELRAKFKTAKPHLKLVRYSTGGNVPGFGEVVFGAGTAHSFPDDAVSESGWALNHILSTVHASAHTYRTLASGSLYALLISWSVNVNDYVASRQVGSDRVEATPQTPAAEMAATFIEDNLMPGGTGNAPRIPYSKITVDFGGDEDIYTEGYKIPQKENLITNQRKTELVAAILAYSKGNYSPLQLSTREGRDMYPYHGPVQGFARGLIEDLAPHTLQYHRLSASPFSTEDLERLRVTKHIYSQEEYENGYVIVTNALGSVFTSITPDQLLSVQDVITRAGQSGY